MLKISLFLLSLIIFLIFTVFSYTVAKEAWQKIDFDTTVKLQDHIPRSFDELFSYFSLIGSAEVTLGFATLIALYFLFHKKILAFLGMLVIFPASFFEVFGKLVVYHPAPPVLFHRNILETDLPSFYIHTNFSYPSGHMTRTIFLTIVLLLVVIFSRQKTILKLVLCLLLTGFALMMTLTRIYLGEHWLSDVIGGALLGLSAGIFSSIFIIGKKYVKIR